MAAMLGSKALGMILYSISQADFQLLQELSQSTIPTWTQELPYLWSLSFIAFILLAYYGLHHTKKGYKLSPIKLITLNLAISIVLGSISFQTGLAEKVDDFTAQSISTYPSIQRQRLKVWSHPEEGRLTGRIIRIENQLLLELEDSGQNIWKVQYGTAKQKGPVKLIEEEFIKLGGSLTSENIFNAHIIAPWDTNGRHHPPFIGKIQLSSSPTIIPASVR